MVSPKGESLAVIPGISLSRQRGNHAFIQVNTGTSSEYFRFPAEEFHWKKETFEVTIGENFFSENGISLNLKNQKMVLVGKLSFYGATPVKSTLLSPGAMGIFSFVPFMECYHGVVSLNHVIDGGLRYNNGYIDFSEGKGYVEKDWGASMPRGWIWMQSNHFKEHPEASIMVSLARIPWLGFSFTGFIILFYYNKKLYKLATYTGAKIVALSVKDKSISLRVVDPRFSLRIEASLSGGAVLKAPVSGEMERDILEDLKGICDVTLLDSRGNKMFDDTGFPGAVEVVNPEVLI